MSKWYPPSTRSDCSPSSGNAHPQELLRLYTRLISSIVQSLLRLHPNDLAKHDVNIPVEWSEWLGWSRSTPQGWLQLVHYYMTGNQLSTLPPALIKLIDKIREVQIPRQPITIDTLPVMEQTGMSPKKVHEVSRMVAYILETIKCNGWDPATLRIVDVGAGQGYLTRALKVQLLQTNILALDADEAQTIGARRWESRLLPSPSDGNPAIAHRTIVISPDALVKAIDEWIVETCVTDRPVQVMLIGLHACGSLTPNVIRTFCQPAENKKNWEFVGAVVVGCCYNLMEPGDFPLSRCMKELSPLIELPTSAYHLAAQVPTQWLTKLSPLTAATSVELALRKVTWRALLGKKLQHLQEIPTKMVDVNLAPGRQLPWSRLPSNKTKNSDASEVGTGATPEMRGLGRLKDGAYDDWTTFLDIAGKKMGIDLGCLASDTERDDKLERFLEVVHTLRCLIGPMVESAIVLDRMVWIEEILCERGREDIDAKIVNLFDQASGSGRNLAIVIAPSIPSM